MTRGQEAASDTKEERYEGRRRRHEGSRRASRRSNTKEEDSERPRRRTTKRRQLVFSEYMKQRILFYYYNQGLAPPAISAMLSQEGIVASRRGILKFLNRYECSGTIARKPGSDGHAKINDEN